MCVLLFERWSVDEHVSVWTRFVGQTVMYRLDKHQSKWLQRCGLTNDLKTVPRPPTPVHGQSQYMWVLKIHVTRIRLQKHNRRCDAVYDGGFALQSTFFGALQRRAAPENLIESHQARKTFDSPPSPVRQGECVALNSRMNSKHGYPYQLASLLGASVHGPTFFCGTIAHIGLFELPRTSVSGHHGRTGAALDVGATLAGSSGENLGPTTGMCARPLTALGYVSLGKATPLHFHKSFTFF